MQKIISKLKFHYKEFLFNYRILRFFSLLKYYFYTYFLKREYVTIKVKSARACKIPITIRCKNRFDRNCLEDVFFRKYHIPSRFAPNKNDIKILDLGSNIGITIIDYKLLYPNSTIYGFEMDKENYELAVTNCSRFSNVNLFNRAVWNRNAVIKYDRSRNSDAYAINDEGNGFTTETNSITIPEIIDENKIGHVDYIKMDIEGAEVDILKDRNLGWMNSVNYMNIEFHRIPEAALNVYIELFKEHGFNAWKSAQHWCSLEVQRIEEKN